MAAKQSLASRLILGDFALSGYLRQVTSDLDVATGDTTVLTSTARTSIPGLQSGKMTLGGPYDDGVTAATTPDGQINASFAAAAGEAVSFAPAGFALGKPVKALTALETSYPMAAKIGDPVDWKLDLLASGILDQGVSLADLAAITADTNGTGVDGVAATANGGCGFLHITAYSGFTNVVFKVQHSTDNSSWADLVTFATVTAVGSEAKAVAAGTTVRQYLRFFADVTGSGSITCQMSFARR